MKSNEKHLNKENTKQRTRKHTLRREKKTKTHQRPQRIKIGNFKLVQMKSQRRAKLSCVINGLHYKHKYTFSTDTFFNVSLFRDGRKKLQEVISCRELEFLLPWEKLRCRKTMFGCRTTTGRRVCTSIFLASSAESVLE